MPTERRGPGREWLEDRLSYRDPEGRPLTWRQIAEIWEKESGHLLVPEAFSMAARRYEIPLPKRAWTRYEREVPWRVLPEHAYNKWIAMLRLMGKERAWREDPENNKPLTKRESGRMNSRIKEATRPHWDKKKDEWRLVSILYRQDLPDGAVLAFREEGDTDVGYGVHIVPPGGDRSAEPAE